ncbi:MAG: tape measure protein, partial [Pseudomonadales bacterium]|nr:tape measure protein [Pseudomonadales bacterium]
MALKEAVVSLVLRAKNAISPEADPAAESLEKVTQEAEKLEAELKDLEKQQEAARGWKEAEENAKGASKALEEAVTAYEKLKKEGKQAGQTQAEYAIAVRQARTAQSIANTEYNRSQRELAKYSRTLSRAGIETNELGQAEDRIQKELDQTQSKLSQATAEAREHGAALEQASQKGGRFGNAMSGIKGKLVGLLAGVGIFQTLRAGITKLITAGSDLEELERQFGALYGSMEEGKRVLEEVDRIAERNSQSLADTAQAARRLQVAGIDPLNGSLQSLIDANAKYGSGAQTLDTVITQLGQAWQGGRLQLEELNSITDSGIPIMEALGTVTGRTGAEIRQMASDGELGKDVMTQLIDELGRMSEGAGAERAKNFTGILAGLRKEFTDFFQEAAKAGALDSLKQRMNELLITLRDMQKDGSIKQWASDFSDSFSGALTAVEVFGSSVAIVWNGITAAFGVAVATLSGQLAVFTSSMAKALDAIGADEWAAELQGVADSFSDTSQKWLDSIDQDGRDIRRHFERITKAGTDSAQETARQQQKASSETREEVSKDYDAIVEAAVEAGKKQKQATDAAAQAARTGLGQALQDLNLDLGELTGGFTQVEQEAITRFKSVAEQIKSAGLEGEKSAKVLLEAFRAAMQSIDSEAGRAELIGNLDQALQNNIITQKEYAEALREVSAAANEVLERTQKAIEASQKTTEQAIGGEKKKAAAAKETSKAYQQQGQAAESAGNKAVQGSSKAESAGAALTRMFYGIRNSFYEVGEGAGQLFDKLYRDQTQFAVLSVGSWLKAVYQAKAAVQEQVTAAQENYDRAMAAQSGNLNAFLRAASRAKQGAHLLGEEKLETLKSAISSAKQQLDSLADSAASTTESLRTELIQMNGSAQDIERRRFEQRQRDLERQMKAASEQGASKAAR